MRALAASIVLFGAGCALAPDAEDDEAFADGKADGAASPLFGSRGPTALRIEAPLAPAFRAAHAGDPSGGLQRERPTDPFAGRVGYREVMLDAELAVRGASSLLECPFPKLKLEVTREDAAGTLFEHARKVKLGTHCGEGGAGTVGRLREEKATWREAALYRAMRALAMPAQLTKPVTVTYRDTSTDDELTRQAFLLEHQDVTAKRLGGEAVSDPELWTGAPADVMAIKAIVRIHFFQALVGNADWRLRLAPPPFGTQLWNIELVELDDKLVPLASDFDLSTAVTGAPSSPYHLDARVLPDAPARVRQAASFLASQHGPHFSDRDLHAARDHFVARRPALEAALAAAPLDDDGRANLEAHVDAFYRALDHLDEIMAAVR